MFGDVTLASPSNPERIDESQQLVQLRVFSNRVRNRIVERVNRLAAHLAIR